MVMDFMGPMIPIIAIIMGVGCAIIAMYFSSRRQKEEQETIRIAMEKGVDLPEDLLKRNGDSCSRSNPLRRGIFWTALGISLTIALYVNNDVEAAVWGLIPLALGIGNIIFHKLSPQSDEGNATS